MTDTVLFLPPPNSLYLVNTYADIPSSGSPYAYITKDTGLVYFWTGSAWTNTSVTLTSSIISDTNSVDLTVTTGVVTADVLISAAAASAGCLKCTTTIKSGGTKGLHVELPIATALATGALTSTDWSTFNGKVGTSRSISTTGPLSGGGDLSADRTLAITKADSSHDGYLAQGDWSTFNGKMSGTAKLVDITPETGGTAAGSGKIGYVVNSEVSAATTTGVGATTEWGDVTSLTLAAGEYVLYGVVGFQQNTALISDGFSCGISATSGNTAPAFGDYAVYNHLVSGTADAVLPIPAVYVSHVGSTTYYLKSKFTYASGAPKHFGKLFARVYR